MKAWTRNHLFQLASTGIFIALIITATFLLRPALEISPSDKNAVPVLAAGITATGVLTTAAVALVGYLFKQSVDRRTTALAVQAGKRADVDQERLQMQTAMETVRLLSGPDGSIAPLVQASAALLVLSKLGQTALALDLAAEMWPHAHMTASSGVSLCDVAVRSGDVDLQRSAAMLLLNNWQRLTTARGQAQWPTSLLSWPSMLDSEARGTITEALNAWCAEVPPEDSDDFRSILLRT